MVENPNSGHRRDESKQNFNHSFGTDLAHDFGGAILFSFPLLMTMEMWWLGFYMDRSRLALFLAISFSIVMGLSYFEGGEETFKIEMLDALVACATGYTVSFVMLSLFGIIKPGMSLDEIVGKISLHAVPGSIGAILARRLLDVEETKKEKRRQQGYGAKVFLMGVGAIFLAFLGLIMVAGSIGFMLYEAMAGERTPPDVIVHVDVILPTRNGHLVKFRAVNEGGSTAEGVTVEGELMSGPESMETSDTTLEYVPSHSMREGGLYFTLDPKQYELRVRAKGYEKP